MADNAPKQPVTFRWSWKALPPLPPTFLSQAELVCRVQGRGTVQFYRAVLVDGYLTARTVGTADELAGVQGFDFGWACESVYLPLFAPIMEYEPPLPS